MFLKNSKPIWKHVLTYGSQQLQKMFHEVLKMFQKTLEMFRETLKTFLKLPKMFPLFFLFYTKVHRANKYDGRHTTLISLVSCGG